MRCIRPVSGASRLVQTYTETSSSSLSFVCPLLPVEILVKTLKVRYLDLNLSELSASIFNTRRARRTHDDVAVAVTVGNAKRLYQRVLSLDSL